MTKFVYDGRRVIKPRGGHPFIYAPSLSAPAYLISPFTSLVLPIRTAMSVHTWSQAREPTFNARGRIWINIYLGRKRNRKVCARGLVDPIKSKQPSGVLAFSLGT